MIRRLGWSLAPLRSFLTRVSRPGRLAYEHLERRVAQAAGMRPCTDHHPEDVFLVSYPKSGSTWFRCLVAGVVYGVDPGQAPYALISDLIPGHANRFYRRYGTPTFFKSHYLPRPDYRRVVYILRDGRDVTVSMFHHLRSIRRRTIDLLAVARGEELLFPFEMWHTHVEAWLSNPHGALIHVVRYEDLSRDPVQELRRFCDFVGLEWAEELLHRVCEQARFGRLSQKKRHEVDDPRGADERLSIRRGEVGSYKDEMPSEVLEAFLQRARPTMEKVGYL